MGSNSILVPSWASLSTAKDLSNYSSDFSALRNIPLSIASQSSYNYSANSLVILNPMIMSPRFLDFLTNFFLISENLSVLLLSLPSSNATIHFLVYD